MYVYCFSKKNKQVLIHIYGLHIVYIFDLRFIFPPISFISSSISTNLSSAAIFVASANLISKKNIIKTLKEIPISGLKAYSKKIATSVSTYSLS